jgi:hypothetical protein
MKKFVLYLSHIHTTKSTDTQTTALHEAASAGSLECVLYLMSQGADKASLNCNGETPFDCTTELEIREYICPRKENTQYMCDLNL